MIDGTINYGSHGYVDLEAKRVPSSKSMSGKSRFWVLGDDGCAQELEFFWCFLGEFPIR